MKRIIRVGTRQSALALTQTEWVIERLRGICRQRGWQTEFECKRIVTQGDRILDVTLSKVGGKGLFVKEIEQGLLDGETDLAVHSMKDVPAELPEGLCIGAVPEREDARDVVVSRRGGGLDELPAGAVVGSSSLRRAAQILAYRPDLKVESIRGNIDTRLRKLEDGGYDAIVLAAAGLQRMGWSDRATARIPVEICVPAVGQGALGIECREADVAVGELLRAFNDPRTERAVRAERAFLRRLNGGCQVPIGAHAVLREAAVPGEERITLAGVVGTPDGRRLIRDTVEGGDPEAVGTELAERLIGQGAGEILAVYGGV